MMLQRGGGKIVNISNVLAERGVPNASLYCAAKGAVRNLVRALALEWARRGIRINMIECGWLDERGQCPKQPRRVQRKIAQVPALPATAETRGDCAARCIYLVSPAAGFVTGESIAIDGGLLCRV